MCEFMHDWAGNSVTSGTSCWDKSVMKGFREEDQSHGTGKPLRCLARPRLCPGFAQALPRPCPGLAQALPRPCPGLAQALPRPCPGLAQALPRPCPGLAQALPRPCPGLAQALPRPCPGLAQALPRPCPGLAQALPRPRVLYNLLAEHKRPFTNLTDISAVFCSQL